MAAYTGAEIEAMAETLDAQRAVEFRCAWAQYKFNEAVIEQAMRYAEAPPAAPPPMAVAHFGEAATEIKAGQACFMDAQGMVYPSEWDKPRESCDGTNVTFSTTSTTL